MDTLTPTNGHHTATITNFLQSISVKETRNILFEMYGRSLNPEETSVEFVANSFFYINSIVGFLEKLEAENRAYNKADTEDSIPERRH